MTHKPSIPMTSANAPKTISIALAILLLCVPLVSAQTYTATPSPFQLAQDNSGKIINNACVWTYVAGTTTAATTYSTATGTPNQNPIRSDPAGRFTAFLAAGNSYKYVYESACTPPSHGTVLKTVDGIAAVPASGVNVDVAGTAGETLLAGAVVYLSDGTGGLIAGQWYNASSSLAYSSSTAGLIAIAPAAVTGGSTSTFRLSGRVTGLTGLTVGAVHYVAASAGTLTATAPTNARAVGVADAPTTIDIAPNPGNQFISVLSKTATYTVAVTDGRDVLVKCDATAGAVTLNLYTAVANAGRVIRMEKTDSSVNSCTFDPNSTETINGASTLSLIGQYDSAAAVSDGTNWLAWPVVPSQPRAVAFNNATQNLAISTPAVLTLNSEDVDVGGLHSTSANTERLTIPTGQDGFYRVTAYAVYLQAASAIDGKFTFSIRKNGTVIKSGEFANPVADFKYPALLEWEGTLVATDYVEMFVDPGARQFTVGSATRGFSSTLSAIRLH